MTFVLDPMSYPAVLKAKALSFHPISYSVAATAFQLPKMREQVDSETVEQLSRTHLKGEHLRDATRAMGQRLHALVPGAAETDWASVPMYRMVWDLMFHAGTDALFGVGLADKDKASDFEIFDKAFPLMVAGLPKMLFKEGSAALDRLASGPPLGEGPSAWLRDRAPLFADIPAIDYGRAQTSILWAINANTIPAAFWSLFYLLKHPDALRAVSEELAPLWDAAGDDADALADQVPDMRMLDSAIREALRLSSGSLTVREVLEPFSLTTRGGSHALRKGDRVCLAPFVTHRDPEIFEDPELYKHDRFYIESGVKQFFKDGDRVPLPLMPFGAGVSMCPGRFFALNEIKLFVAMALHHWELELSEAATPEFDYSRAGLGIYPPAHDVPVRVRRRS